MSRSVLGNEARRAKIQDDNDYFTEQYIFENREDAAKRLAAKLKLSIDKSANEFIILAIPRGGVVTGDVIASSLGSNLDIVVSRKIGAPYNPELAVGAIMHDGSFIPNEDIIKKLNVSQEYINEQIDIQKNEIERRLKRFRGGKEYHLRGRNIILVDDGMATGATMFAVIKWLGKQNPKRLVVAVPVAPKDTFDKLKDVKVEDVVVLRIPIAFSAVGEFYQDFSQVSDEEVIQIMNKYK